MKKKTNKSKVRQELLKILDELKRKVNEGEFNSRRGFNEAITKDFEKNRVKVSMSLYRKRDVWTKGVLNRTQDGYYVFFIDYDMMQEHYIIGELRRLQEDYDLGDINIFKSSEKGFHAVSSVKLTAREYVEILQNSSCDQAFRNLPRFSSYRNWVLRNFAKGKTARPKYIRTLRSAEITDRQQSSAHYKWYGLLYPQIQERMVNPDKIYKIDWIEYATGGNV